MDLHILHSYVIDSYMSSSVYESFATSKNQWNIKTSFTSNKNEYIIKEERKVLHEFEVKYGFKVDNIEHLYHMIYLTTKTRTYICTCPHMITFNRSCQTCSDSKPLFGIDIDLCYLEREICDFYNQLVDDRVTPHVLCKNTCRNPPIIMYVNEHLYGNPLIVRDYQKEYVTRILESPRNAGISIKLPSNSGKTLIGIFVVVIRKVKTLWLCQTERCVEQVRNEFLKFCTIRTDFYGITISTQYSDDYDLIIFDDCAPKRSDRYLSFQPCIDFSFYSYLVKSHICAPVTIKRISNNVTVQNIIDAHPNESIIIFCDQDASTQEIRKFETGITRILRTRTLFSRVDICSIAIQTITTDNLTMARNIGRLFSCQRRQSITFFLV